MSYSRSRLRSICGPALLVVAGLVPGSAAEEPIDFARDVRPIFNAHCVECHGGVKQASGVSFVYREQVLGRGDSGSTIVTPGDVDASELIRRVTSDDEGERMPPVDEHPEGLPAEEIDRLTRWVEEGAAWSDHWSFVPPRPAGLPDVKDKNWSENAIDRFVLARLEQEQIEPAPDERPERWLRRVTLDLTGLPPSPEERTAFLEEVEKSGEAAYARAVDRLLMSPQFGERWASIWLDQVRYADSRGLGQDGRRNIWKYRDWVIDAFNDDLPYDEFTVQQIAGDLLPDATIETRLATAVHRLTQQNEEGGTDDEEFRTAAVLDRVNTLWQTWQGLTFGCVQCHSHPYEPFRHEEYYRFVAFFNNTADCDLNEDWPVAQVPLDPAEYDEASRLDEQIGRLRRAIWEGEVDAARSVAWRPLRLAEVSSNNETKVVIEPQSDHDEFHTVGTVTQNTDFKVLAPLPEGVEKLTALRFTGLPLDPQKAVADSEWGFVLSHLKVRLVTPEGDKRDLELAHVIGDEPDPFFDPRETLRERSHQGFAAYSRIHYPRQAAIVLAEPVDVPAGAKLELELIHRVQVLGAFSLVTRRGCLSVTDDPRLTELLHDEEVRDRKSRLVGLQSRRGLIKSTPIPVLEERPDHLARPTHVFERGLFLTKGAEVQPSVPDSLPPLSTEAQHPRLALAKWLVSRENPLTARVAVNRFWARLFGTGLVETEEDFGSSGERPSHPELLDYLALRFQNEHDWSTKSLLREIVLSRTYRQSSRVRPDIYERDPQNRLLATGPRHRLPAELIRDQGLAVSGLLSEKMFGPPVHPPIPDGVWKPFQAGDKWNTPAVGDEDRYRRSIYTYTKRSIPYPMFAAFDAPSREFCTPRRLRSNTPLQALMTLNDESFMECARALARRMAEEESLNGQLTVGYRLAAGVECDVERLAELKRLFEETAAEYREDQDAAAELGESPEEAALVVVASVLLNLDEVVMK